MPSYGKIGVVGFVMILLLVNVPYQITSSGTLFKGESPILKVNWLNGWKYRIPIIVENNGTSDDLYDYQILIRMNTSKLISAGLMREDCGDIRFTDYNGNYLSYWIKPDTVNTSNTEIWVKIPKISASSIEKIFVYFGNDTAVGESNGTATFVFFDDFENYPVNTSNPDGWIENYDSSETWSEGHGIISTDYWDGFTFPSKCLVIYGGDNTYTGNTYWIRAKHTLTESSLMLSFDYWSKYAPGNGGNTLYVDVYVDGSRIYHQHPSYRTWETVNLTMNVSNNFEIGWSLNIWNAYETMAVDNVRIRKYVSPEPKAFLAPLPPQNLSVSAGDGYIMINWSKPLYEGSSSVKEYRIYRGTTNGNETLYKVVSASTTRFLDTNVTNGINYFYYVTAANSVGESDPSEEVNAIPVGLPTSPLNLTASAGDGYIKLSWDPPSNDGGSEITGYKIYRGMSSGNETLYAFVNGTTTTYTDRNVTNGDTYYYQVSAVNSGGEGPKSNEVSATPLSTPSAPQNLTATSEDGKITLRWDPPFDNGGSAIKQYNIYRGTKSGSEVYYTTLNASITTYTDTNVMIGQTYYYQVSAVNDVGEGPKSNEASATPQGKPSAPLNLQANAGDSYVILSWDPPSNDGGSRITEYRIYRGSRSDNLAYYDTVNGTITTYTDKYVKNGQTYYYAVSAVNKVGEGPKSNIVNVTPTSSLTVPSAPQNLTANAGDGYVVLSWNPPAQNGGSEIIEYRIYRGTTSGNETLYAVVNASTTRYTDKNVTNGHTYYYRVSAVNIVGEGPKSNEVYAKPESSGGTSIPPKPKVFSYPYLLIALIIIAAVIIGIIAYIIARKKKIPEKTQYSESNDTQQTEK